jgi:hypothetical protein
MERPSYHFDESKQAQAAATFPAGENVCAPFQSPCFFSVLCKSKEGAARRYRQ